MGTHPNTILQLTLTPDDTSREILRDILAENNTDTESDICIGEHHYHHQKMDDCYDRSFQISAKEGDIVVFSMVTYGYGDQIPWDDLADMKRQLEEWAKGVCNRHKCKYEICVTSMVSIERLYRRPQVRGELRAGVAGV